MPSQSKHDEGCLERRKDHLFLCTCGGMMDVEAARLTPEEEAMWRCDECNNLIDSPIHAFACAAGRKQ